MTAYYQITTMSGDRFNIHELGRIERLDMPFTPSDTWTAVAIVSVNNHTLRLKPEDWQAWLDRKPEFLYKNGNAKFTLRDLDHGTMREWSDRIRSIKAL